MSSEEAEDALDRDGDGAVNETENSVDFETFKEHLYNDIQPKFDETHPKFKEHDKPAYLEDVQALITAADAARTAHSDVERKYNDVKNKVDDLEKKLETDYGGEREWAKTHGVCYESPNGECVLRPRFVFQPASPLLYHHHCSSPQLTLIRCVVGCLRYTYVVCPFDKVEQKEGGRSHSLG